MKINVFEMERGQCLYEHAVDYNLSESGVTPLRIEELLDDPRELDAAGFLSMKLSYAYSNGSPELRERISKWYPGAEAANITITNGSSEANFIEFWGLLEKGDRAAIMIPTYMQTWGLAEHFTGRKADAYRLIQKDGRWALDVDSLHKAVTKKTKVILVTNPNNPVGAVLNADEMDEIVRTARKVGAWIVSDEVYRGAELNGAKTTPTLWGRYPKVLITSGLSKAFGMPGVRIGWIAGPAKQIAKLEIYRDYTTLAPSAVSDRLATVAMEPKRRDAIFKRTRGIVREQLPRLEEWIKEQGDRLEYTAPVAGAIAYVKYRSPIAAQKLFDRLRIEKSVLITPGNQFGMSGKYIRIGYGYDIEHTMKGVARIGEMFDEIEKGK